MAPGGKNTRILTQRDEHNNKLRDQTLRSGQFFMLKSTEHYNYHAQHVKIPAIVGILTFSSIINTTYTCTCFKKEIKSFCLQYFTFLESS